MLAVEMASNTLSTVVLDTTARGPRVLAEVHDTLDQAAGTLGGVMRAADLGWDRLRGIAVGCGPELSAAHESVLGALRAMAERASIGFTVQSSAEALAQRARLQGDCLIATLLPAHADRKALGLFLKRGASLHALDRERIVDTSEVNALVRAARLSTGAATARRAWEVGFTYETVGIGAGFVGCTIPGVRCVDAGATPTALDVAVLAAPTLHGAFSECA